MVNIIILFFLVKQLIIPNGWWWGRCRVTPDYSFFNDKNIFRYFNLRYILSLKFFCIELLDICQIVLNFSWLFFLLVLLSPHFERLCGLPYAFFLLLLINWPVLMCSAMQDSSPQAQNFDPLILVAQNSYLLKV